MAAAGNLTAIPASSASYVRRPIPAIAQRRLKIKCQKTSEELFQAATLSRRGAVISLSTSLASSLVSYIPQAEARIPNADIKRNILEKFKILREKTGLGNEKKAVPLPGEKTQPLNQFTEKIEKPKDKVEILKETPSSSNQITEKIEEIKEKVGLSKEKISPSNQVHETKIEPKESVALSDKKLPELSPSNPIVEKIEELKGKMGLSNEGKSFPPVKTKLETSEAKLTPVEQIKEKFEILKSRMGLSAEEGSVLTQKETDPHPIIENPQSATIIMQGMELIKEKLGLSTIN